MGLGYKKTFRKEKLKNRNVINKLKFKINLLFLTKAIAI